MKNEAIFNLLHMYCISIIGEDDVVRLHVKIRKEKYSYEPIEFTRDLPFSHNRNWYKQF